MANLKFVDTHNMVAFLSKPTESEGFEQIVDFLNANPIKYALTINPTIYISCIEQFWSTVKDKTVNGEVQVHALVVGKKVIIIESIVRRDLQLEDAEGVDCLPNATIFEQLALMSMVKNLDNVGKFLMYPRFMQVFLDQQLEGMPTHNRIYIAPPHTKKIFRNIRREGKGFFGRVTPLFPTMVVQNQAELDEAVHKELGNSLVRAATTASSLEAEKDSGGGPRCQETMGDIIAQTSLKRRVKKLKKKDRKRTHKLKRLYKIGLTARVESSGDEESFGEDASKQGRINAIDADDDITLVNVQDDADKEMFNVDALVGEEVFIVGQNENVVKEVIDAAQDRGKGITVEEPVKMKKKDQLKLDEEIALKLQAEINEEERISRAEEEKTDESNITWDDIQAKVDADY
ncbi:hypothetical protein Tco_1182040 [Tanacetum coccineum]